MIWLATVSLAAGAVLAQRFKIIILAPASAALVLVGVSAASPEVRGVWSILVIVVTASVALQVGYFLGMLSVGLFPSRKSSDFSDVGTAQKRSISRTSIS
jgi:membrane protein DedA with SNARE-associated domain